MLSSRGLLRPSCIYGLDAMAEEVMLSKSHMTYMRQGSLGHMGFWLKFFSDCKFRVWFRSGFKRVLRVRVGVQFHKGERVGK